MGKNKLGTHVTWNKRKSFRSKSIQKDGCVRSEWLVIDLGDQSEAVRLSWPFHIADLAGEFRFPGPVACLGACW